MKSIIGYHDKNKGSYVLIEKNLPVLIDDRYEPFMMSTKQFFTAPSQQILPEIQVVPIQKAIKKFKNTLATILIIPGTISAIIYIIDFLTATAQTDNIPLTFPAWLSNLTFWIAVIGAMILWHETYRYFNISEKVLNSNLFSDHEINAIKQGDLGLSKLTQSSSLKVLTKNAKEILLNSVKNNELDSFLLLNNLILHENSIALLDKLDLSDFPNKLEEFNINSKTLPKYPLTGLRSLLIYATQEALETNSEQVGPEHLMIALFRTFPALTQYLKRNKQNTDLMKYVVRWLNIKDKRSKLARFFDPKVPYTRTGGISDNWIYGYTFVLSHFSTDLTKAIANSGGHFGIGHEKEIDEILSTLSKTSNNNVLLIGESGTGKTSLAKAIAERINKGSIPDSLKDMRIIKLELNTMIASAPKYGNLESAINQAMLELQKAGNTILFIDEIQEIAAASAQETKHSLAGILLPYILESKFPIIGTITYADYKKFFYSRESLRKSFQTVEINPVSPQAAFEIILNMVDDLEKTYGVEITFPAILTTVELAQRYVFDRKLPDSAVNVIEATCASIQNSGEKKVTAQHVARVISTQTEIPVEEVSTEEATKLLNLEEKIREKVIGQEEAVHQVVEALKRARAGVRDPNKPIGTFFFLGPTGVGKTYLAKTLSKEYFGEDHDIIRLDMSEYKEISSVEKLLGSSEISETAQTSITFLDQIKKNPFSVVLLDEVEKAHPQILDLFLQLLDEGRLTSNAGETVNFNNTIIIATSNIGSKTLLDALEQDKSMFEEAKERVILELRQKVRVEFLNRFDKVIVFHPHNVENLTKITILLLKELKARLLEKEISIEWEESVPKIIAIKAQEPGMGARPLRRYIQDNIEAKVATKLLEGEIKTGDTFMIKEEMIE